jgi:hypothetical protein
MTELACIGHWYTDLLYLAPVLVMGGFVGRDKLKTRRDERRAQRSPGPSAAAATARVNSAPARSSVPL